MLRIKLIHSYKYVIFSLTQIKASADRYVAVNMENKTTIKKLVPLPVTYSIFFFFQSDCRKLRNGDTENFRGLPFTQEFFNIKRISGLSSLSP